MSTLGDSEQYLVGAAAASSRAWSPHVTWCPVVLVGLDVTAIAAVVAVATSQAVPLVYVSAYAGVLMALLAAGGVYSEKVSTETPGRYRSRSRRSRSPRWA